MTTSVPSTDALLSLACSQQKSDKHILAVPHNLDIFSRWAETMQPVSQTAFNNKQSNVRVV